MSIFSGKNVSKNLALISSIVDALDVEFSAEEVNRYRTRCSSIREGVDSSIKIVNTLIEHRGQIFDVLDAVFAKKENLNKLTVVVLESVSNIADTLSEITRK